MYKINSQHRKLQVELLVLHKMCFGYFKITIQLLWNHCLKEHLRSIITFRHIEHRKADLNLLFLGQLAFILSFCIVKQLCRCGSTLMVSSMAINQTGLYIIGANEHVENLVDAIKRMTVQDTVENTTCHQDHWGQIQGLCWFPSHFLLFYFVHTVVKNELFSYICWSLVHTF